jgi:Secretion system C-terminal sorting domain
MKMVKYRKKTIFCMKHYLLLILCLCNTSIFAQPESEFPLLTNSVLQTQFDQTIPLRASGTFDSTFIYTTDTLTLPFFDDFSKNKFQKYNAGFADPGVTSLEFFHLLDGANTPYPDGTKFSVETTVQFYVDANGDTIITNLPTTNVQIGPLTEYPVVYVGTPVYPPYNLFIDTLGASYILDTLWVISDLVEQDSATQFFKQLNDPTKLWLDDRVYHNYHMAKNPWSIGVATFDGLDRNGFPYSFGSNGSDYADLLTSKPIDLTANLISDSIYFSFLYQRQGLGEEPEVGDSLTLELYNPGLNVWQRVWAITGGPVSDFRKVHIPIADPNYFAPNFQFRFRNYGSLAGGLDHFHLDYVAIRQFSNWDDTLFKDYAFVYPTGSLLKDYTSVPWDHYKANSAGKMNDSTKVVVRNGSNLPENNQNGSIVVSYNGTPEGNFVLAAQTLSGGAINYAPTTTYVSYHDLSGGYQFDIAKPGTKQTFDIRTAATAPFTDSTVNDTTYTQQHFANYYSYDDGTAERAYSFTGTQGRLAMRFDPYEADSVIGVSIHFSPSVVNAQGDLFALTIWGDNNGTPGALIYEDNLNFPKEVEYDLGNNRFVNYFFYDTTRVRVDGPFFIGWRQFDPEPLNIGLDKNNDNSDYLFYSLNGGSSWTNSSIEGTIMLRPIFSTSLNAELNVEEEIIEEEKFVLFPNPAKNNIEVLSSIKAIEGLELFNLQGQLVRSSSDAKLDISDIPAGVYLVRPVGSDQMLRLIKE